MPREKAKVAELVTLPDTPWWRYRSRDGTVTVSMEAGKNITNERVAWLLDKAKSSLIRNNV